MSETSPFSHLRLPQENADLGRRLLSENPTEAGTHQ
jgi:hypothetical protein